MSAPKVFSLTDFGGSKTASQPKPQVKKQVIPSTSNTTNGTAGYVGDISSDTIIVDPTKNIDINRIHDHVMSKASTISTNILVAKKELRGLLSKGFVTDEEQVMSEPKMLALKMQIEQMEAERRKYDVYASEAEELIDRYLSLVPTGRQRVVGTEDVVIDSSLYGEFCATVAEFINLAQRFATNIYITTQQANVERCRKCHGSQVLFGCKIQCTSCGHVMNLKESGGVASGGKNEYYRADTFEEHMAQYQGRQKKPIPPEVFQKINEHCKMNQIDVEKLSKGHILRILKKYKLSDYYNSVNSIANILTGAPLPDIRRHERTLLEKHRLLEKEYMMIRDDEGRNNFLFGWYVLQACMVMEGLPVNKDDFLGLTTRDALVAHDKLMIRLCDRIRERQKEDTSIKGNWLFKGLA